MNNFLLSAMVSMDAFLAPLAPPLQQAPTFNFNRLALGVGVISLSLCGVILAGSFLFPEAAEQAKRTWIPNTIVGLVIVSIAGFIIGLLNQG